MIKLYVSATLLGQNEKMEYTTKFRVRLIIILSLSHKYNCKQRWGCGPGRDGGSMDMIAGSIQLELVLGCSVLGWMKETKSNS